MTNYERIKSMTVEEMVEFICYVDIDELSGVSGYTFIGGDKVFSDEVVLYSENDIKEWLQKEYKG